MTGIWRALAGNLDVRERAILLAAMMARRQEDSADVVVRGRESSLPDASLNIDSGPHVVKGGLAGRSCRRD